MTASNDDPVLAIVGSPSTNAELTLNLTAVAYDTGLVGALIYLWINLDDRQEVALGTVNQIATKNQWHENSSLQGIIKTAGVIPGLTSQGDIRNAEVRLQAAYYRTEKSGQWYKGGPSLNMSPPTGSEIRRVTDAVLHKLLTDREREDVAYLGAVYRNPEIRLPTNMRDFADERGAIHTGIFGTTGAGKTAIASLVLGCQLRHSTMAVLVIDPQGQFRSDKKTLIPIQALANLTGRKVDVLRISHDLRLPKNSTLLCELLKETEFFKHLDMGHRDTMENASRLIRNLFSDKERKWTEQSSEDLLAAILHHLSEPKSIDKIIKTKDRRLEIADVLAEAVRHDSDLRGRLLTDFRPLHSLFSPKNLNGGRRRAVFEVLRQLMTPSRDPKSSAPRPYVVLDMSRGDKDEYSVLDDEVLKARILLTITGELNRAAEKAYANDRPLNSLVLFDEAHRYAPPTRSTEEDAVKALTKALAKAARETRKYGVGWTYITQNIDSLHPDIFDMLGVRICGYGLGRSDLRAMEDHIDSRDSLELYRTFANPDQTEIYPYMITGPFSPLSFTQAPVFVESFAPDRWLNENRNWIAAKASAYGRDMPRTLTIGTLRKNDDGGTLRRNASPTVASGSAVRSSLDEDNGRGG